MRRLFTFGSPITPLALRSDPVVETLAREDPLTNRLDPKDYGLTTNPAGFEPLPTGHGGLISGTKMTLSPGPSNR